jgi:hypothetical protein
MGLLFFPSFHLCDWELRMSSPCSGNQSCMERRAVTTIFIETRLSAIAPAVSSDGEAFESTRSDHVDVSHRGLTRNDGARE